MRVFLFSIFFILYTWVSAHAATSLYLNANVWTVGVGQETQVQLSVDSDQAVNAFHVVLRYPIDLLEYVGSSNGGSIISNWVTAPSDRNGIVTLEGVVPGGFSGTNGLLVTLTFRGVLPGMGWIVIAPDSEVLSSDGQGTAVAYVPKDMQFRVVNAPEITPEPYSAVFKDTTPPEPFVPQVSRDPGIFNGRWFVVFEAQDKNSGIDHYDVAETSLSCDFVSQSAWHEAQSPFVLSDQGLHSYICVRAVDKAGNNRVESVAPTNGSGYAGRDQWVILVLMGLAVFIVGFNIFRKRIHHHA